MKMSELYVDDDEEKAASDSVFRQSFKLHKNKENPVDFNLVVDVDLSSDKSRVTKLQQQQFSCLDDEDETSSSKGKCFYLKRATDWNVYSFVRHPGVLLARDIFRPDGHVYWSDRCLRHFGQWPNVSNVEIQLTKVCGDSFDGDFFRYPHILRKLRWITLGYHHDWNSKEYSEEKKTPMPREVIDMSRRVADLLGFVDFQAEAAIVNFYRPNSTLAGHVDRSERNRNAPLLSFSFGQSAVFLIGGESQQVEPTPVYLRNGDLLVMSDSARLAYHAVPRIVKDFHSPYSNNSADNVVEYLNENRINLNVRQVN